MKDKGYYYKTRLRHTLVCFLFVLLYLWVTSFNWVLSVVICFIGMLIGYSAGIIEWNKIKNRIDKRNSVIIYYSDGILYSLLIVLFFLQYVSMFKLATKLGTQKIFFDTITGFFIALCFGLSMVVYLKSKNYEKIHGKLKTKLFYSRSVTGAEGMISKKGIFTSDGKVKVGNEIWNAVPIDDQKIAVGDTVIVRDIEGLKLVVEKIV
jgi:membrane protein implicated in regulation of membrane protease activity